jgi:hypothetical protein
MAATAGTYDEATAEASGQLALIQWVEFKIDELSADNQTPAVNHGYIYRELREACVTVLRAAPDHIVARAATDGTTALNGTVAVVGGRNVLPLPDDFIRFLRLTLDGWKLPVDELIRPSTNLYRGQLNPNSGNDTYAPLGVLVPYVPGPAGMAIEAFPWSDAASPVLEFYYVPATAPEAMPPDLHDALTWGGAAKVFMSHAKDFQAAQNAQAAMMNSIRKLFVGHKGEDVAEDAGAGLDIRER